MRYLKVDYASFEEMVMRETATAAEDGTKVPFAVMARSLRRKTLIDNVCEVRRSTHHSERTGLI